MSEPQPPKQINVELPKDLDATYANFAIISHSPHELVIDFAQLLPAMPKARVQARVLLTPVNAKMLHQALGDNLAKYERRFGVIGGPGQANFDPHTGKLGGLQWTVGSEDESSDEG
ncbi:MAG: DUF3467 domain-containing protein [Anaerolinea sp.]|nr:DUF3467 domain-containing protein [Anaerolinea sp.]HRI56012.1 DUF3467 domain-containing protein [Anaerolineae bacterium]